MSSPNPKIDLVFRKLFGSVENKDLLLSLVNAIVDQQPRLTDLTITNPYNFASYVGGKTTILDIKAVDDQGTWYDIELQIGEHGSYGKRALYYLSKMYVDQLGESESYATLNKTIGIHLLDFAYFPDNRYRRHFVFKDMETNEVMEHLSYQQLYFIEMSKFGKDWDELGTLLDRWIAFLNRASLFDRQQLPEPLKVEKEIVRAMGQLDVMFLSREEREIYEAQLKSRRDDWEEIRTAEDKGRTEGLEEGRTEGLEEGRTEGLEEGRKESAVSIAGRLLNEGAEVEFVARVTGLSPAEVTKLVAPQE